MRKILTLFFLAATVPLVHAQDYSAIVRKVVERSTLDQQGTKPFHLKAVLTPSHPDRGADRTGEVEIWWASPTKWKREVRSPDFHQIAIANGKHEWQKNEGDYFPEWLREIAVELINPVPALDEVVRELKGANVKSLGGNTYFQWTAYSTDGQVKGGMGGGISITNRTGLLFTANGTGWDGWLSGLS